MNDAEIREAASSLALGFYLSEYPDAHAVSFELIIAMMDESDGEKYPEGLAPWYPFESWSPASLADEICRTRERIYDTFKSDRIEVWGKSEGFCAWCVDGAAPVPVWEHGTDSQGYEVKYACCQKCAAARRVEEGS